MRDDLNRYLTEAEQEQIDKIFAKGMRRRREEKGEGEEQNSFLLFKCQEEQYVHSSVRNKEINDENMRQLMSELCKKCREHNCCYIMIKQEEEESLPFPREKEEREEDKAEIRKIFNNGRMEMLFSLVHSGKLTLEDAQNISGLDEIETKEMYDGWKIAQEM